MKNEYACSGVAAAEKASRESCDPVEPVVCDWMKLGKLNEWQFDKLSLDLEQNFNCSIKRNCTGFELYWCNGNTIGFFFSNQSVIEVWNHAKKFDAS